jgi:protein SCO1
MLLKHSLSSRAGRLVVTVTFATAIVLVCATLATVYLRPGNIDTGRPAGELPPILYPAPDFEFTTQNGDAFTKADLNGKIWVSNFMFTSCPSICPLLTERMKVIAARVAVMDDVHLMSFSVDPATDTPAVLLDYAARYEVDHNQWSFLTGNDQAMRDAIEEGFKVSMGGPIDRNDLSSVMHGTRFVLGDQEGNIRGYYDVETDDGIDLLIHEIKLLRQAK